MSTTMFALISGQSVVHAVLVLIVFGIIFGLLHWLISYIYLIVWASNGNILSCG